MVGDQGNSARRATALDEPSVAIHVVCFWAFGGTIWQADQLYCPDPEKLAKRAEGKPWMREYVRALANATPSKCPFTRVIASMAVFFCAVQSTFQRFEFPPLQP